ncbi:hypothetical protein [Dermacoccus barathri]|uniref:PhiRv1 phage protein n=1 Tax=Dermacoccus barathri TaxID=322601 RepID=A0ABN2C3L4_9MICO
MSDPVLTARARLAYVSRRDLPHDATTVENARRDLNAAKLERWITETLAAAPPLSDEQRRHLAALIAPAGGAR